MFEHNQNLSSLKKLCDSSSDTKVTVRAADLSVLLESSVAWQLRYEQTVLERDKATEDYNELWRIYTQILADAIVMKRRLNSAEAETQVLLDSIRSIAESTIDDADNVLAYAGIVLETFNKDCKA